MRYLEEIPDELFSKDLISKLPLALARSLSMLPIVIDGVNALVVADPGDLEGQRKIELITGSSLEPVAAERELIADAIGRCYGKHALADKAEKEVTPKEDTSSQKTTKAAIANDLLLQDDAAPVTRLVNSILLEAVRSNASDIHFEPFAERTAVRFRIDGVLHERAVPPKELEAALISRLKVMAGMDIAERRLPQDGMSQVQIGNKSIDIRTSTIPVADGERVVLRLLNRDNASLPMQSLGMTDEMLSDFRSLMHTPNGIIIVSGPTGSGKTTTLYAALGELDSKRKNILTIEDPVEYRLPNIGQIQVKPKIGLTFASGLRHILRQDPDIVLVGETRDPETAEIAVRASLTGHLVFTTLHTNDAPSAIMRLTDMGIPPYLLASSLRGVLAQRLVRRLCPHCAERKALTDKEISAYHIPSLWQERLAKSGIMQPRGCDKCTEGYKGRQGIFELMSCTSEIASLIRGGVADGADLNEAAQRGGMLPMLHDALHKVELGITDLGEVAGALAL